MDPSNTNGRSCSGPSPYVVTLWADESLIRNPTSIAIDDRGRVWATEAVNYREGHNQQRKQSESAWLSEGDRVVIIEDTDDDGLADQSTVFAQDEELISPTGICLHDGRVFVSCSPHILEFIDDDGDDVADRKEIFLTGFGGQDHDHGVHSLVSGPDGRLYFAVGNAGPHVVTDKSGRTLQSVSPYQTANTAEPTETPKQVESKQPELIIGGGDETYVGGLALSVNPDGTDLRVHSHNSRNPYELCVDSAGNLWQTDNDDTSSCRMTWLMDGSNQGFASKDGNGFWQADQRPGQDIRQAHWHQSDPGVLPAGDIYGTGAPTGLLRYEHDAFGANFNGTIIACDAGLGCVFAFRPIADGAGFRFERTKLVWTEPRSDDHQERKDGLAATWFRPSDVAIGPLGDLFIADWYDSYVGAHRVNDLQAAGRIYRLQPGREKVKPPDAAAGPKRVFRSIWEDEPTAWAALRDSDPDKHLVGLTALLARNYAAETLYPSLGSQPTSVVRRELLTSMRGRPIESRLELVLSLAKQIDSADRFAIEAFGLACQGHEELVYTELRSRMGSDPTTWSKSFAAIAWRLHPDAALLDLQQRIESFTTVNTVDQATLLQAIDTIGFNGSAEAKTMLKNLAQADSKSTKLPKDYLRWWIERIDSLGEETSTLEPLPIQLQPSPDVTPDRVQIDRIAAMAADKTHGRALFFGKVANCSKCHSHDNTGGNTGPDLTHIRERLNRQRLIEAIIHPSLSILTGFESWSVVDDSGKVKTGLLISTGANVVLRTADGELDSTPRDEVSLLVRQGTSLMPTMFGDVLDAQQVADITEFLSTP